MQQISLVIPSHNRHRYLDRILCYYADAPFDIIIADSTPDSYSITAPMKNVSYYHLPGKTLTFKLSCVMNMVKTPYVFMCADDDFIISDSVAECVDFLNASPDYVSAQGNSICYMKGVDGSISFAPIYTNRISYEITDVAPLQRLVSMMRDYRSIFYAVHRTQALKSAFIGAERTISNLYLNEYLTTITLAYGRFRQFSFLYQVREYSFYSDDKVTQNIDQIFIDQEYSRQFSQFLDHFCNAAIWQADAPSNEHRQQIRTVFENFAQNIRSTHNANPEPVDKKFGDLVRNVPFVGRFIIAFYRQQKRRRQLDLFVQNDADRVHLKHIKNIILSYAGVIK